MVPSMDLAIHTSDLENRGFSILSIYNFKDLRGGQEGTGDEQTFTVYKIASMLYVVSITSKDKRSKS